jgi:hypothetical protein
MEPFKLIATQAIIWGIMGFGLSLVCAVLGGVVAGAGGAPSPFHRRLVGCCKVFVPMGMAFGAVSAVLSL